VREREDSRNASKCFSAQGEGAEEFKSSRADVRGEIIDERARSQTKRAQVETHETRRGGRDVDPSPLDPD
jgi:hypothetical protein